MSTEATSQTDSSKPSRPLRKRALFGALNFGSLALAAWGTLKFLGHLLTVGLHDAGEHGWTVSDLAFHVAEVAFIVIFIVMVLRVASGVLYALLGNATGKPSEFAAGHRKLVRGTPIVQMMVPAPCLCCGRGGPKPWGYQADCAHT